MLSYIQKIRLSKQHYQLEIEQCPTNLIFYMNDLWIEVNKNGRVVSSNETMMNLVLSPIIWKMACCR